MPHKNCQYYVEQNNMCLLFFELGFHEVSQYHDCLKEVIYDE